MAPPNQTQAEIARMLLDLDSERTVQMRQQLELMEAMRQARAGQTVDMAALETRLASLGSTASSVGSSAASGASRASSSYHDLSRDATTLGDDLRNVGEGLGNLGEKTADSWDNLGRVFHQLIPTDLRSQIEGLQQTFGGLTGPGGVMNSSNTQVSRFRDVSFEIHDGLLATGGAFADAFGMVPRRALGDTATVLAEFNEYISGPQGMLNGLEISKVATGEMALELRGLAKSMNLSAEEMQTFMTRQISLTGEAGTDMAREAAVFSQRLARATGDSAKFISQNIVKIIDDTKNFGNVTVDEAARISVTLRQLGIGYEELGGMVNRFTSFDQAAQSVSALTTVFGVQLDAMEMMHLANEDQESFLRRMREQFLMTGKSVQEMTRAEKLLIAEQLSLSGIQAVERLFDPTQTISSMEELTSVTDDGIGGTQEVMAELAENIVDLQSATEYSADAMMTIMRERMLIPSRELAIEMEENYTRMGASFERAVPTHVADAMTSFGEGISSMLSDTDMEQVRSNLEGIAETITKVDGAVENFRSSDIGTALEDVTETRSGVPGLFETAMEGFSAAATDISDAFGQAIDAIIAKLEEVGLLPVRSPHPLGKKIFVEGFGAAGDEMETRVNKNFDRVASHSVRIQQDAIARRERDETESLRRSTAVYGSLLDLGTQLTQAERERFESNSDYTSAQLRDELDSRDSVHSRIMEMAGQQQLAYEDLTNTQKQEYAAQLRLGSNYEAELRLLFESEAYQRGSQQTRSAEQIEGLLEEYADEGTSWNQITGEMQQRLTDQYGITEEMYNEAMGSGANITDIASRGQETMARAQRERDARGETESEEDSESSRSSQEANRQTAASTRAMVAQQRRTNELLSQVHTSLSTLKDSLGEMQPVVNIEPVTNGPDLVDYIIKNPRGTRANGTVAIKD